ncbi:patatin-like protein 1 [Setaria italica]|uniref:patatin-like protein 1 n=1 Tax=Setaria italica TaxID=4555 RepID=UPI000648B48E|nr:patatin-like protein 1 [Setaria italica]
MAGYLQMIQEDSCVLNNYNAYYGDNERDIKEDNQAGRVLSQGYTTSPTHYSKKLCVLSIGTGVTKHSFRERGLAAAGPAHVLQRVGGGLRGRAPLQEYKTHGCEDQYLRIQEGHLEDAAAAMDDASEANMESLVRIGNELLAKPLQRTDWETGRPLPVVGAGAGTNAEALTELARKLRDERRRRLGARRTTRKRLLEKVISAGEIDVCQVEAKIRAC